MSRSAVLPSASVGALLSLCLWALPAQGREVWRDDERRAVLEVQGFYKSLLTGVVLQPALVEGTSAFSSVLEQARGSLPAEQAALLPSAMALPSEALLGTQLLRASSTFRFEDRARLEIAWQGALALSSDPALSPGASLSATILGSTAGAGAKRRLLELGGALQRPGLRLEHQVDRLALTLSLPVGELTLGRQVLSWGTGRLWNPTDVLSPFPPTALDREVRRGFDAVRLAIALGDTTQLDILYLPQLKAAEQGGAARFQTNLGGWDVSFSCGKYVSDTVVGADLVGDVGPLGVHAEGAYTVGLLGLSDGAALSVGEHSFRGVVGADFRPAEKWVLMAEYHFNGAGAVSPAGYAATLSSARVSGGEVFGAGRHYLGLVASWRQSELLSVALTSLINLADASALLLPALEYWFEQTVLVRASATVPLGAAPDARVFTALEPSDVLTGSEAMSTARRTLGLRSEYGASSFGALIQVGLYLP